MYIFRFLVRKNNLNKVFPLPPPPSSTTHSRKTRTVRDVVRRSDGRVRRAGAGTEELDGSRKYIGIGDRNPSLRRGGENRSSPVLRCCWRWSRRACRAAATAPGTCLSCAFQDRYISPLRCVPNLPTIIFCVERLLLLICHCNRFFGMKQDLHILF